MREYRSDVHPSLVERDLPYDQIIWRYMKLNRFEDMVKTSSLWFSRLDIITEIDRFEGSITKRNKEIFLNIINKNSDKENRDKSEILENRMRLKCIMVNCWCANDFEKMSMWDRYTCYSNGLAIQSTYKKLQESIIDERKRKIYFKKIRYINYETDVTEIYFTGFDTVFNKKREYSDENELRVAFKECDVLSGNIPKFQGIVPPKGIPIKIDLNKLIDNIILNPMAGELLKQKIEKILLKHNLNKIIKLSELSGEPIY